LKSTSWTSVGNNQSGYSKGNDPFSQGVIVLSPGFENETGPLKQLLTRHHRSSLTTQAHLFNTFAGYPRTA